LVIFRGIDAMKLRRHSDRDYADAQQALLPPGAAWQWPVGGLGDGMLLGAAQELTRIEDGVQAVLDEAIELHRPQANNWHISAYRAVAIASVSGVSETMPRRPITIGSKVGDRMWSQLAGSETFPVELVAIDQLIGPARVGNGRGSRIGDRLWGSRSRYILRVRYYRSVVDPAALWAALTAFKQAHVYLWFEDITGAGGAYAQN